MLRFTTLFSTVTLLSLLSPLATAHALVPGLEGNTLIKLYNDNDPKTVEDSAVYYFDRDWKRRPFPNQRVFQTWYKDFSGVKELTKEQMAEFILGKPVTYRPGSRLVKIPSIPKVYAVEPGGVLRWIASEAVAKTLYGADWSKRVEDVSETVFLNFTEGTPLTVAAWPTGTVVRRVADGSLFYIDGAYKRHLTPHAADAMAARDPYIVPTTSDLSDYLDGGELLDPTDRRFRDASQLSMVETLPPPQVDFPLLPPRIDAPSDATLAEIRVTTGEPATVKRVTVTLNGELRRDGVRMLEHVRIVDEDGADIFGIHELAENAGISQTFVFDGAWTLKGGAPRTMRLKANVHPLFPAGTKIGAAFDRAGFRMADASGDLTEGVFPRAAFPTVTVEVQKAK